ncbi:RNA recognition motif [Cryptosporidium ryanae]|uniref:RNA recognition motif n=1 Tax=Cryptosporidium ryanae TaxID=515981 RepID=UPI003519F9C5|nr:RNA recognition motif [Cryptosporidium ryanae]
MSTLTDEFIKSLSKEELEETVVKLRNELSNLYNELKFWKCRACEDQIGEDMVLKRSEVTEEMLNELNNIANKVDEMESKDENSNNLSFENKKLLNNRNSVINMNNSSNISNSLNSLAPLSSMRAPPPIKEALKSDKSSGIILKRAPPIMSKAEFMKYKSTNLVRNNKIDTGNKRDNKHGNKKFRTSLQWGCSSEEYPLFNENIDKNIFKDYFSEFDKKMSLLFKDNDIDNDNIELKIHSKSVFCLSSDEYNNINENIVIPKDKLFEWFIESGGESNVDKGVLMSKENNNTTCNNIFSDNSNGEYIHVSNINENKTINGSETSKNYEDTKIADKNIQKERSSLFCSKTSKMLQITINYFKKKLPKDQQKNLLAFKKSILECTLDKEGVNLLLETVPDPVENPSKFDIWKECVNLVENYLKNNSRESLLEEEEFVYFLSRIPNLSKRLECMILRSSFEQLYNESLKWINEKIQGLELILNNKKLPLLFKSIVDSRNILNNKLNEMNNNHDITNVRYIPLSSMKKLNNLKSPNVKGKTLMNFICSIVGEVFTNDELFILKKSSEKNISIIYTMVTDLLFSWLDLRDNTNNFVYNKINGNNSEEINSDLSDKFEVIMKNFYAEKYDRMIKLSSTFKYLLRLYVASCYYFGDIKTFLPINMKLVHDKQDLVDYLMDFTKKYNLILAQEVNKGTDGISPKDSNKVEIKSKLFNIKEPDTRYNPISSQDNNHNKLKTIFSNNVKNSGSSAKTNIKELFTKSIVKELNLKPLFNKGIIIEDSNNNCILNNDKHENNEILNSVENVNIEDIEQTTHLSDTFNYNQIYNINGTIKRNSILELSDEAKEILSRRNQDISENLNSSIEFGNTSNYDTSDNDTIALSSPSYTKLLDINSLMGSCNDPESLVIEENSHEKSRKKKVVIMTEDVYSPVKQNNRFNRRQSIKRMCQMASYLDNFEQDSPSATNNYEDNYFEKYKSPISKGVSFRDYYNDTPTENDEYKENDDASLDSVNYTKTCVLNDILDFSNLNKENSTSDNYIAEFNKESCENIELTPEKTISSRRTIKFGATISPHN